MHGIKWNHKKYSIQKNVEKEEKEKNRWEKQKTNSMMIDLNQTMNMPKLLNHKI